MHVWCQQMKQARGNMPSGVILYKYILFQVFMTCLSVNFILINAFKTQSMIPFEPDTILKGKKQQIL